jgi:hypothetical protein
MTWRETLGEEGATSIYCSGTSAPTPVANIGKAIIALGVVLLVFIARIVGTDAFPPWIMPLMVIAFGAAIVAWRGAGGPSVLTITITPTEARFTRGSWRNPLVVLRANIADVLAGVTDKPFNISTSSPLTGPRTYSGSELQARVAVIERDGAAHVVACFGEERCARYFAERVLTLLGAR